MLFKLSNSSQATRKSRFNAVTINSLTLKIMVSSSACKASRNACSSSQSGGGTLTERTRISAFGFRVIFFIYCFPSVRIAFMINHSLPTIPSVQGLNKPILDHTLIKTALASLVFPFIPLIRCPLYQHHRPSSLTGSLAFLLDIL